MSESFVLVPILGTWCFDYPPEAELVPLVATPVHASVSCEQERSCLCGYVGSARDTDDLPIIFWCVPVFVGEATTKINSTASYGIECLPSAVVPHLEND